MRYLGAALAAICLLAGGTQRTLAQGVVGSGTPSSCTEAALDAALAGGGLVTFNCGSSPHTITVTRSKLITQATTIDGGGLITLSGGGRTHVLENNGPLLTLKNLTIADGYRTGENGGGGVYSRWRSNLTVENSTFRNNVYRAASSNNDLGGGAIFLQSGLLTVSGSRFTNNRAMNSSGGAVHLLFASADISATTFDGNSAGGYGGAVYSDGLNDTGTPFIRYSRVTFTNNAGQGQGGAVFAWMYYPTTPASLLTIESGLFQSNRVTADAGGAAFGGALRVGNGPVNILDSTFATNTAASQGGALWTGETAAATVTNVTFSGNRADDGAGGGLGGAMALNSSGGFTLTHVTLADNHAGFMGGAIWGDGRGSIRNTLFANNTAGNPWGQSIHCGATFSGGGSIQSPTGSSDRACIAGITRTALALEPLADNGGLTPTRALPAGSPAIDAGMAAYCPPNDQRGRARNFDGDGDGAAECDSGAFEYSGFNGLSAANAAPFRAAYATSTPNLTWSPVTWAQGYRIEVDDNLNFSSPVFTDEVDARTLYAQPRLAAGLYFWRVRAVYTGGTWGGWSAPDTFAILD